MSDIGPDKSKQDESESEESAPNQPDFINLQANFSQQQAKIHALKELVRKTESNQGNVATNKEKVRNIAERLTFLRSKARSRHGEKSVSDLSDTDEVFENQSTINSSIDEISFQDDHESSSTAQQHRMSVPSRSETPGIEKIQLLRKQLEQSKAKMAEREHSKRDIEELVTKLKAKFDDSRTNLEKTSQLGHSVGDLSVLMPRGRDDSRYQSYNDLTKILPKSSAVTSGTVISIEKEHTKMLERKIKELEIELKLKEKNYLNKNPDVEYNKQIKHLENKILDLEESLREKQCIIDARTLAVSLMSENLSLKGKTTVDLLEETRLEMHQMQEKFIETEESFRDKIKHLEDQLDDKNRKILNMEEMTNILETTRFELTVKNAKLENLIEHPELYYENFTKLTDVNQSLRLRISELESLQLKQDNNNNKDTNNQNEQELTENYEMATKLNIELSLKIDDLNQQIKKLQEENEQLTNSVTNETDSDVNTEDQLKQTIADQKDEIAKHLETISELEKNLNEKSIEYNVLNVNFQLLQEKLSSSTQPKPLFSIKTDVIDEQQVTKLKAQIDEANKATIKMKLKNKQLQKLVDSLSKATTTNSDLVKLTNEIQQLQQKNADLIIEMKKIENPTSTTTTSANDSSDLIEKVKILETTCQNQISAIQLLEEQKVDLNDNLHKTKTELHNLKEQNTKENTIHVTTHMDTIEFEETIDRLNSENQEMKSTIKKLTDDNESIKSKLDLYMTENIDLLDKIEKLSKGSSAESIEIVENLTCQEKLEMEEYHQQLLTQPPLQPTEEPVIVDDNTDVKNENISTLDTTNVITESLVQLSEESSELMHKIELFTNERREVLAKMDSIASENQNLLKEIEHLNNENVRKNEEINQLKLDKDSLIGQLAKLESDRTELLNATEEIQHRVFELETELSTILISVNAVLSIELNQDKYSNGLKSLAKELETYKKAKDKSIKFNVSKKLAKECENIHLLMEQLIDEHLQYSDKFISLREQLESVKTGKSIEINRLSKINLSDNSVSNVKVQEYEDKIKYYAEMENSLKTELSSLKLDAQQMEAEIEELQKHQSDLIHKENETMEILRKENERLIDQVTKINNELMEKSIDYDKQIELIKSIRNEYEIRLDGCSKELEIVKTLSDEQKQQLIDSYTEHELELTIKLTEIKHLQNQLTSLTTEYNSLKDQQSQQPLPNSNSLLISKLTDTIDKLESQIQENNTILEFKTNDLINKQTTIDTLNQQIIELYKSMETNGNIIEENEREIGELKTHLERNSDEIRQLTVKLTDVNKQLENSNKKRELNKQHDELEQKNLEQLTKLKKFAANLKKKNAQCSELEEELKKVYENNKIAEKLHQEKIEKYENELQIKINDLNNLNQLLQLTQDQLNSLKYENNKISVSLQQNSVDSNRIEDYETQIRRLNEENKNLKTLQENFDSEITTLNQTSNGDIKQLTEQLAKLKTDLNDKNLKIEKCKKVLKDKNNESKTIKQQLENQLKIIADLNDKISQENSETNVTAATEVHILQNTICELEQKILTIQNGFDGKLQENHLVIETLEIENARKSEQIIKLEDNIKDIEDKKDFFESQTIQLDTTYQEKLQQFEQNSNELLQRLDLITGQNTENVRKLKDFEMENKELNLQLKQLSDERQELLKQKNNYELKLDTLENVTLKQYERDNNSLTNKNQTLQQDLQNLMNDYDQKINQKHSDLIDLENEMSTHLKKIEDERKIIHENYEKLTDENGELKDEIVRLKETITSVEQLKNEQEQELSWLKLQNETMHQDQIEIQELRMQIVHDQTEMDNLKSQHQTLIKNHELELLSLRQQIAELDALRTQVAQNQTDDQVFIQNENQRLDQLLTDKLNEINGYQMEIKRLTLLIDLLNTVPPTTDEKSTVTTDPICTIEEHGQLNEIINNLNIQLTTIRSALDEQETAYNNMIKNNNELLNKNSDDHEKLQKLYNEQQIELQTLNHELMLLRNGDIKKKHLETAQATQLLKPSDDKQTDAVQLDVEKYIIHLDDNNTSNTDVQTFNSAMFFDSFTENNQQKKYQDDFPIFSSVHTTPEHYLTEVFEETIMPKKAYLCHPSDTSKPQINMEQKQYNVPVADTIPLETTRLETKLHDLESLNQDLENRFKMLTDENDKILNDIRIKDQQLIQLHNLESCKQDLENKCKLLTDENDKIVNDIRIKDQQLIQLHGLESRNQDLENRFKMLTDENDKIVNDIRMKDQQLMQLHNLESYNQDLEKKLKMLTDENDKILNEIRIKDQQLNDLSDKIRFIETELQSFKDKELLNVIEKQIVYSDVPTLGTDNIVQEFNSSVFFTPSNESDFVSMESNDSTLQPSSGTDNPLNPIEVVEEIIIPKHAYLCHPTFDIDISTDNKNIAVEHIENQVVNISQMVHQITVQNADQDNMILDLESKISLLENKLSEAEHQHQQINFENECNKQLKYTLECKISKLEEELNYTRDMMDNDKNNSIQRTVITSDITPHPADAIENVSIEPTVKESTVFSTTDTAAFSSSLFTNLEDDTWGWDSKDAILEAEHLNRANPTTIQTSIIISPEMEFNVKLQEYEDKLQKLELEKDRLHEEKIALQVKSGKMLKKLKEYQKKTEFKKSVSCEPSSNDLDEAIQEEFRNQINSLEAKEKEIKLQLDKEQKEKSSLQKRVEVLTTANDHLTELKERQDIQLEIHQSKIKELSTKILKLEEWSDDNYNKNQIVHEEVNPRSIDTNIEITDPKIQELQHHIDDLSADNEEFQALLEDEKSSNKILEERLVQLQNVKLELDERYEKCVNNLQKTESDYNALKYLMAEKDGEIETLKSYKTQLNESILTIDDLTTESRNIKIYLDELKRDNTEKINENNNLSTEYKLLLQKNSELSNVIEQMNKMNETDNIMQNDQSKQYDERVQELTAIVQYKDSQLEQVNQEIAQLQNQHELLVAEIKQKDAEILDLRNQIQNVEEELIILKNNTRIDEPQSRSNISDTSTDLQNTTIRDLEAQIRLLSTEKCEMEHELQTLNEQVMRSFKVEDELKAVALDLDTKNIEINELKNSLKHFNEIQSSLPPNDSSVSTSQPNQDYYIERIRQLENDSLAKDKHLQKTIEQLNGQWEVISEQRCSELAESWRQHLNVRESEFAQLEMKLHQRNTTDDTNIGDADKNIENLSVVNEENTADYILTLRRALQSQEEEIVTLKEQLAIRCAEFARIVAQFDPHGKMMVTSSSSNRFEMKNNSSPSDTTNADLEQKFNFAQYLLYQKDMRCQELTEELRKILEERDILQLKLSKTIGELEYIKQGKSIETTDLSQGIPPVENRSAEIIERREPHKYAFNIDEKISQLRGDNVNRNEYFPEMSSFHQNVAKIPPEAVAELFGNQSQKSSNALLEWFWGKST